MRQLRSENSIGLNSNFFIDADLASDGLADYSIQTECISQNLFPLSKRREIIGFFPKRLCTVVQHLAFLFTNINKEASAVKV